MIDGINPDILFFFDRRPAELELFLNFQEKMLDAFPQTVVEVKKTQISFRNRYIFACASLQRMKGAKPPFITIAFGLGERVDNPRIAAISEPYPGRWTHHVTVSSTEDIDDELMGWIELAAAFAAGKR